MGLLKTFSYAICFIQMALLVPNIIAEFAAAHLELFYIQLKQHAG